MRQPAIALSISAVLALAGCGASAGVEPADWDTNTEASSEAAEPCVDYALVIDDPPTTRRSRVRVSGSVAPGSDVYVDDELATVNDDGSWEATINARVGDWGYPVEAQRGTCQAYEDQVTVVRKRTKAQIARDRAKREARAAAQRAAAEERRRKAEERRARAAARREAQFQQELQAALNGSNSRMSSRVAREIMRMCGDGTVQDFDICFEAGYATGGDIAEKYSDDY